MEEFESKFIAKLKLNESKLLEDDKKNKGFVAQLEKQKGELATLKTNFFTKIKDIEKFHTTGEDAKLTKKFDQLRNKIDNSPARSLQLTNAIDLSLYLTYDVQRHKENIKTQYCPHHVELVETIAPILPIQTPRSVAQDVLKPLQAEESIVDDILPQVRGGSLPQGFEESSSSDDEDTGYESFSEEDWVVEQDKDT